MLVWWLRHSSVFMFLVIMLFFIFLELLSAVAIWGPLSKLQNRALWLPWLCNAGKKWFGFCVGMRR